MRITFKKNPPKLGLKTYNIKIDGECVGKIQSHPEGWFWYAGSFNTCDSPDSLEHVMASIKDHFMSGKIPPPPTTISEDATCSNCDRPASGDNNLCDRCACPTCGMLNPTHHMCTQPCQ